MRVTVLSPGFPPAPGGVSDYARAWARALAAQGLGSQTILTRPGAGADEPGYRLAFQADWGLSGVQGLMAQVRQSDPDVVVVHYEPHMYHPRGLALGINMAVARLGRERPVVTIAHELYYGRQEGWRKQPHGLWQRLALGPLIGGSRRFVVTVPDRLARLRQVFPKHAERLRLMPVGPNVAPAAPEAAAEWRARLGLAPGTLLLLFMGLAHPSKALDALVRSLDALADAGVSARLAVVGGARVAHPHALELGFLGPAEAACALGAADMALLPLADGASTRRTSLMNVLGAGLPTVSTVGANTGSALFERAVALVPANRSDAFAEAVVSLARNEQARQALGVAAKRLHDEHFAWEILGRDWHALLSEAAAARP